MKLSKVDWEVLVACADDYVNIPIVKKIIYDYFHRNAKEEEIIMSLKKLLNEKLLDAYEYDTVSYKYMKAKETSGINLSNNLVYVTVTEVGRKNAKKHAVEDNEIA